MRYRRPSKLRRVATLRVAMIGALTLSCTACVIPLPLAIYPTKCAASGNILAFHDETGKLIEKDGLLLIQRSYSYGWPDCLNKTFDSLVEIERGKARIPTQTKVVSLWALPNLLAYFLLPSFLELPEDDIKFVPLISGVDFRLHYKWDDFDDSDHAALVRNQNLKNGAARLLRTSNHDHGRAVRYSRFVLERLRREADKKLREHHAYFYLPDSDYLTVKEFLEARLEQLQRPLSPKCPTCGYNLTGNESGKCPECGNKILSTQPAPSG